MGKNVNTICQPTLTLPFASTYNAGGLDYLSFQLCVKNPPGVAPEGKQPDDCAIPKCNFPAHKHTDNIITRPITVAGPERRKRSLGCIIMKKEMRPALSNPDTADAEHKVAVIAQAARLRRPHPMADAALFAVHKARRATMRYRI